MATSTPFTVKYTSGSKVLEMTPQDWLAEFRKDSDLVARLNRELGLAGRSKKTPEKDKLPMNGTELRSKHTEVKNNVVALMNLARTLARNAGKRTKKSTDQRIAELRAKGDFAGAERQERLRAQKQEHLNSLYLVTDQIVNFLSSVNLGRSVATLNDLYDRYKDELKTATPELRRKILEEARSGDKKDNLRNDIAQLVLDARFATSAIMTSLFSIYFKVNGLQNQEHPSFNSYTELEKYLGGSTDTKWRVNGKVRERIPSSVTGKKKEELEEKLAKTNLSGIRIASESRNTKGAPLLEPGKGIGFTATMVLFNRYRMPSGMLTKEEEETMRDPENVAAASDLHKELHTVNEFYQMLIKPDTDEAQKRRKAELKAAKSVPTKVLASKKK